MVRRIQMSFKMLGLDHIQITAPLNSEEEVRHFFVTVLGCPEVEKPESMAHFKSLWFDIGTSIVHVGLDERYFAEKRGHPAFIVNSLDDLMARFDEFYIEYAEDENMPGARRLYTYAFFGHRMEFLEWVNKPDSVKGSLEN